jgi:hypothetical protein
MVISLSFTVLTLVRSSNIELFSHKPPSDCQLGTYTVLRIKHYLSQSNYQYLRGTCDLKKDFPQDIYGHSNGF